MISIRTRAMLVPVLVTIIAGCGPTSKDQPVTSVAVTTQANGPVNIRSTVTFIVAFDQAVSGFNDPAGDVRLDHSGTTGGQAVIDKVDDRTYSVRVSGLDGSGSFTLTVAAGVATDSLGNPSPGGTSPPVLVDNTAPVITINPLTTSQRQPQLSGTVDDSAASIAVTIGTLVPVTATNNGDGTWTLTSKVDMPDGTHSVVATATDRAGNSTVANGQLVVDTTPPHATVDTLATADTTPPLSGTVDDATASVQVTVDGQTYSASNSGGRWTIADGVIAVPLALGWHDVTVATTDAVGNTSSTTTSRALRITQDPLVDEFILGPDNRSMLITFDQPVYGDAAHSVPIGLGSLQLFFERSDDPVTGVTMAGISNADGGSLLGAMRVRVDFNLAGGPTLGLGFVRIQAAPNAIWNAMGQLATRLTTGWARLRDPRNLLNDYEWSFDKFLDMTPSASWHVVNAVGTLAQFHSGLRSVLFADPTSTYGDRSITLPNDGTPAGKFPVTAGTAYKVSVWVYVKQKSVGTPADTGIRLQLKMGRTGGSALVDGADLVPASMNTWQRLECTVSSPADSNGKAWMIVQAADLNPNDSDVYVDDLRVELATP